MTKKKKYDGWVIERTTRGRRRFLLKKCVFRPTQYGCWLAGYYAWREEHDGLWELFYAFKKRMIAQGTKPVKVRFIKVED